MTEIVLFHHVQGLTPGVAAFADRLRDAGHTVHTPDMFEGRTFGSIDEGMSYVSEIGFSDVRDRGVRQAQDLPAEVVYAGFSFGVMAAQTLLQTRPGARGGLFYHGFADPSFFGEWPDLPVQVHAMEGDPWFEEDRPAADAAAKAYDDLELFLYPGSGHLFTDATVDDHDEAAAAQVLDRSLELLARLDG